MTEELIKLHLNAGKICGKNKTCKGKINYKTEKSAIEAAFRLNNSGKARHEVEAYPCYFCNGWHLGRKMDFKELEELNV